MRPQTAIVVAAFFIAGLNGPALAAVEQPETLVSTRLTSVRTAKGLADVRWTVSSDVATIEASSLDTGLPGVAAFLHAIGLQQDSPMSLYRYTYTFESTSAIPVRFNFSDPQVANSPLSAILQDFSFALQPGQVRSVQFLSTYAPNFVVSHVNNSVWDAELERWDVLGTRRASLYVPSWSGPTYVEKP
jgi:hypothetical protein